MNTKLIDMHFFIVMHHDRQNILIRSNLIQFYLTTAEPQHREQSAQSICQVME